jgi:hypothetical protein
MKQCSLRNASRPTEAAEQEGMSRDCIEGIIARTQENPGTPRLAAQTIAGRNYVSADASERH